MLKLQAQETPKPQISASATVAGHLPIGLQANDFFVLSERQIVLVNVRALLNVFAQTGTANTNQLFRAWREIGFEIDFDISDLSDTEMVVLKAALADRQARESALQNQNSRSLQSWKTTDPPLTAIWLLDTFLDKKTRDDQIGDLTEEYEQRAQERGIQYARAWLWGQVVRTLCPNIKQNITNGAAWLLRDVLGEWFRRLGS